METSFRHTKGGWNSQGESVENQIKQVVLTITQSESSTEWRFMTQNIFKSPIIHCIVFLCFVCCCNDANFPLVGSIKVVFCFSSFLLPEFKLTTLWMFTLAGGSSEKTNQRASLTLYTLHTTQVVCRVVVLSFLTFLTLTHPSGATRWK